MSVLGPGAVGVGLEAWPPEGAQAVEIESLYDSLGDSGLEYGPAFQGVQAVWRRGDEVFAEVALAEDQAGPAGAFGIHPALFDAALHGFVAGELDGNGDGERAGVLLPSVWNGVELHAAGASSLRVRLSPTERGGVSLIATDETGAPVVSVEALAMRALSREQLGSVRRRSGESLFGLDWVAVPVAAPVAEVRWAVLAGNGGGLAQALESAGVHGVAGERIASYTDLEALGEGLGNGEAPVAVLVDCGAESVRPAHGGEAGAVGGVSGPRVIGAAHEAVQDALELLRRWLADERYAGCSLVFVTGGAVAARADEDVQGLAQAPIWGLVRAAQAEHPGRLLLVDLDGDEVSHAVLARALETGEPQMAIREGEVLAPRLVNVAWSTDELPPLGEGTAGEVLAGEGLTDGGAAARSAAGTGTLLVTGGTGDLGALLVRHLVAERDIPSVILASRRGHEAPGAAELEAELVSMGARVVLARCDVSNRNELQALLNAVPQDYPLQMVVHAAGVRDDGVIDSLTERQVERALAPKIDAAWHLHELTEHLDLTGFVLVSSAAGTLGNAGQGGDAAANAFLDALAAYRRARGLTGNSLAWGPWAGTKEEAAGRDPIDPSPTEPAGDAASSPREGLERLDAASSSGEGLDSLDAASSSGEGLDSLETASSSGEGIDSLETAPSSGESLDLFDAPLSPEEGLELFDAALAADRTLLMPMRLNVKGLRPRARSGSLPAMLRGLVRVPVRRVSQGGSDQLTQRLLGLPEEERQSAVLEFVRTEVARVLGKSSPNVVPPRQSLIQLGLDSFSALELRNRLSAATGLKLQTTLVFDYPDATALADLLLAGLSKREAGAQGSATDGDVNGTLSTLLVQASAQGMIEDFMELLMSASKFRPVFDACPDAGETPEPIRFAVGDASPSVILLPSILAISGPHQYMKFAGALGSTRDVTVLPLPGFGDGEPLPATIGVAIEAHAESIRRVAADAPFVLAGHSSGGNLAYVLASYLESIGVIPAGVVLMDTYALGEQSLTGVMQVVMDGMLQRDGAYVEMSDTRLTAMAVYGRLLLEWPPTEISAPTLLLRATESMLGSTSGDEWRTSWSLPHTAVDVPGNHFTMMEDHAEVVANEVQSWLSTVLSANRR